MRRRNDLPRGPAPEAWLPRRDTTVLLLSASVELQGAVGRVSAAAAVELIVGDGFGNVAGRWDDVAAVLVDSALLADTGVAAGLAGWRGPTAVVGFVRDSAQMWQQAELLGADRVAILPDSAPWLANYLSCLRNPASGAGVVGIVGGCGGAGASTLAVLVAAEAARRGTRTLLVDGDPWGGGLCAALSAEDVPGLRWPELLRA
ncbi:MAG: septum site-determining protein Ssd, partial [Specibacter sp.]